MIDELKKQNKNIKKRITYEGLIKKEKQNIADVKTIKRNMKLFLQGLFSVGALLVNFALGFSSVISFF